MLNGDLANYTSSVFGVRCDGFLVDFRTSTLKDRIANAIVGKCKRAHINEKALSLMNYIFRSTEYTVDLVILESEYTPEMKEFLEDKPFSQVVLVHSEADIAMRLMTGDLSYYVDGDVERLSRVQSPYALTPEAAFELIRSARVGRNT